MNAFFRKTILPGLLLPLRYRLHVAVLATAVCLPLFAPHIDAHVLMTCASFGLMTFFVYVFNKAQDQAEDAVNRAGWHLETVPPRRLAFLAVAALLLPIPWLLLQPPVLVLYLVLALMGYAYSTPIPSLSIGYRLKDVFIVKNIIPALGGFLLLAYLSPLYHGHPLRPQDVVAGLHFAFVVFAVEVVWDIRDMEGDGAAGIQTIANSLGVPVAKLLAFAPLAVFMGWLYGQGLPPWPVVAGDVATLAFVLMAGPRRRPFYYHAIVLAWIVLLFLQVTLFS